MEALDSHWHVPNQAIPRRRLSRRGSDKWLFASKRVAYNANRQQMEALTLFFGYLGNDSYVCMVIKILSTWNLDKSIRQSYNSAFARMSSGVAIATD
jgi:hypothetical protein